MSKYKRIVTEFRDEACLRQALQAAGLPFEEGDALHLFGYLGDRRPETAQFVVRRQHIGSLSNDLGYRWNAEAGAFEAVVSSYDTRCKATTEIRRCIRQQYAVAKVTKEARARGLTVVQQRDDHGVVRLTLRGYAR